MQNNWKGVALPLLIIAVGVGWLLTVQEVLPGVNWVWVLGLGISGVLVIAVGGVDKATMVIGPLLIIATVFSLLRQTGRISVDTEVPCMVIAIGALLLMVRLLPIPMPKWLEEPPRKH